MSDQTGTIERKEIKVIPFGPGEAHLQNKIDSYKCHICKKDGDDMVLLYKEQKNMVFACVDHPGVCQEFIKQFHRLPLGWQETILEEPKVALGTQVGKTKT